MGLQFTYELSQAQAQAPAIKPIATIEFDEHCQNFSRGEIISTGLKLLAPYASKEFLVADRPFAQGADGDTWFASSDQWLVAALWVNETEFASLEAATESAYRRLLDTTRAQGFPYWVRVWNYFEKINALEKINAEPVGLERYRHFCVGRYKAFKSVGIDEKQFPSACALGHGGGGFLVYLLASKQEPKHFENPLQVSAYEYPSEYGPKSPSFARASLVADGEHFSLYLSGTASVVGHATQHPFELIPQIKTTLQNIGRMLEHVKATAADYTGISTPRLILGVMKVYIRNPEDLAQIKAQVEQQYPAAAIVYVQADICRADLLLEIDGVWSLSR